MIRAMHSTITQPIIYVARSLIMMHELTAFPFSRTILVTFALYCISLPILTKPFAKASAIPPTPPTG
jgi:hypothetical protein